MKVLVAYASRHGSTRGIAESVGRVLGQSGLDVTVSSVDGAEKLGDYDAFVVGSAAYAWHWLKDATAFVQRNAELLASRPTWLFSSGPIGDERVDKKGQDVLLTSRPKEFADFAGTIKPRGLQVFFGAYDPDAGPAGLAERVMKFFMKLTPAMRSALPIGDFREWPVIEAWANGVARELKASQAG